MPNPLAAIWEDDDNLPQPVVVKETAPIVVKKVAAPAVVDYGNSEQVYELYLTKQSELPRRRQYAKKVATAIAITGEHNQTLVKPLATMGGNGGCLLCDYCGHPIRLEGSTFDNMPVDKAWQLKAKDKDSDKWKAWIKGGMAVVISGNGTLRIYHGYGKDKPNDCDYRRLIKEREFVRDNESLQKMWKWLDQQKFKDYPNQVKLNTFNQIVSLMFSYDNGFGVNYNPKI